MKTKTKILNFIKGSARVSRKFFSDLLSNRHEVSMKRLIALLSFGLLSVITCVSLFKPITPDNASLLRDAMKYLSGIIGVGLLGISTVDVVSMFCGKRADGDLDK